jgi:acylaminoacyl-peptidase
VTGGSGGGVLTCWMIGRTDRFRAAVSAYPVINWTSFVLTADISAFVARYWFPALPWADPAHYEKRSLLSVVKNVKTPAMIITGEEDYRTPMSESEQYYQALKLLGVEAVWCACRTSRTASRSSAPGRVLNIVGWFDQHRPERHRGAVEHGCGRAWIVASCTARDGFARTMMGACTRAGATATCGWLFEIAEDSSR